MLELKNKNLKKIETNENEFIDDINIQMLKLAIANYMDKYAEGKN
jgi:hypothetical protein